MIENNKSLSRTDGSKLLKVITFLVWLLINIFLLSKHEMWRDEAQAWAIAKNLSLKELFYVLRIEGHPCLWFLFLMPFAKLGFSFYYIKYVSLLIMCICAYLLIFKSNFSYLCILLILFSSAFTYYNVVIVRIYGLALLICMLICFFYKERYKKPYLYFFLISLLFQTHVKYFGLALGLCIEYILNKKNDKKEYCLSMPIISIVILVIELIQFGEYKGTDVISSSTFLGTSLKDFIYKLYRGFERIAKSSFGIENIYLWIFIFMILIILIMKMFKLVIENNKLKDYLGIIICSFTSIGAYYIITAFIHGSHAQMATILSGIVITIYVMICEKNSQDINSVAKMLLVLFMSLSYVNTIKDINADINNVYSYGEETARYISENIEENSVILLNYDSYNPLVYSCTTSLRKDILFYDLNTREEYKYHRWGLNYEDYNIDTIDVLQFENRNVYLLSAKYINSDKFDLVYENISKYSLTGENYCIYKFNQS